MDRKSQPISRRTAIKATAGFSAGGIFALSGCQGDGEGGNGNGDGNGNGNGGGTTGTAGNGNGNGADQVDLTLASTFESDNIMVVAAEDFAERVEEESDGDISIEISAGGAYGAVDEIADLVRDGNLEMHVTGLLPFNRYASEWSFIMSHFVLEDFENGKRLLESDEFGGVERVVENGNQRLLGGPIYRGARHFTSNEPVRHPDDVDGFDLRLPETDFWVDIWTEIGANPTPVALDELYSALQQGVVDASEGDIEQVSSFDLNEVQDYYSLTNHMPDFGNLYINEDFWQDLDETHQDILQESADPATSSASEDSQAREEESIQAIADEGMTVVEDVDQEAFVEAGRPAIEQLFEERWEGNLEKWRSV